MPNRNTEWPWNRLHWEAHWKPASYAFLPTGHNDNGHTLHTGVASAHSDDKTSAHSLISDMVSFAIMSSLILEQLYFLQRRRGEMEKVRKEWQVIKWKNWEGYRLCRAERAGTSFNWNIFGMIAIKRWNPSLIDCRCTFHKNWNKPTANIKLNPTPRLSPGDMKWNNHWGVVFTKICEMFNWINNDRSFLAISNNM